MVLTGGAIVEIVKDAAGKIRKIVTDIPKKVLRADALNKIDLPITKTKKIIADAAENPGLKTAIETNPELSQAWNKLDDLKVDEAIKRNPLHLEVTSKLDELQLDPNFTEANKLIKNINEGLAQAGEKGVEVANKIKSGVYDQVEGYKDLIKQIKKSGDVNPELNNNVIPVRQTLNKLMSLLMCPQTESFLN